MDFNYLININKLEEYLSSYNESKAKLSEKINSFESSSFSRSDNYKISEIYLDLKSDIDKINQINNSISKKLNDYINTIKDEEKSIMDFSLGADLGDFEESVTKLKITDVIDSRVDPIIGKEKGMDFNKDLGKYMDPYEFALLVLTSKVKNINGVWYYYDKNGNQYYRADIDGVRGIQCVDGFKIWCKMMFGSEIKSISELKTGNDKADGYYKLFNEKPQYFKDKFELIEKPKSFRDGDVAIWNQGGKTHEKSHIAFLFKVDGKWVELGQNQGGDRTFRILELSDEDLADVAAVLRPHAYDKYFEKKGS